MNARQPRFEVVRTTAGWHARFRAVNGRIVWWTEVYSRRRSAVEAVEALSSGFVTKGVDGRYRVRLDLVRVIEVREVDERGDQ